MIEDSLPPSQSTSLDEALQPDDRLGGFVYTDRDGYETVLDEQMERWICDKVGATYDKLDAAKSKVKQRWTKTERAINGVVKQIKTQRFSGLVPYGKQSVQTLVAHFWSRSLQTPNVLFNVTGNDEESKESAPIQKQNLMRLFKKDRLQQKLDGSVNEAVKRGVVIGYLSYETRKSMAAVPLDGGGSPVVPMKPNFGEPNIDEQGGMAEYSKTDYDAASFRSIDALSFVFDTTCHQQWDSCFKAMRDMPVYEDIADSPHYQNFEDLREEIGKGGSSKSVNPFAVPTKKKPGAENGVDDENRIERIETHGDFRLKDGTLLRNWTITVAGRKRVIRFEKNPIYLNPFIKWEYEETEDGWGISPIDYIIPLIDAGSMLLNSGVEAAKLSINPPCYAPKGMLPQKQIILSEGQIIEYTPNPSNPADRPIPVPIKPEAPFPFLQLFETQSEATTGATRQLSGSVTSNDNAQTATEFQGLQVVGNLILDRLIDLFNADFKIPVIEKFAKITAMFNPEEVSIPFEDDEGKETFKQVQPKVYFGDYDYVIEDNKSELERKQTLQQQQAYFAQIIQDPDISARLKKVDMAKQMASDLGYGSPGKFFMNDEELVEKQLTDVAIAQTIAALMQQTPLGPAFVANGWKVDTALLNQLVMAQQGQQAAAMQAQQEGMSNGSQQPEGSQPIPGAAPSPENMAGIGPGMEGNPNVDPSIGGQLPGSGGLPPA